MSHWWKYVVGGMVGSFIAGNAGLLGGLYVGNKRGYERATSEHKSAYVFKDFDGNGDPDLCVVKNKDEMICSLDINHDGAQDVVTFNVTEESIKDIQFGKSVCKDSKLEEIVK